jgi:NAD(P)-dependent dehydrogenase (short-subunit alcohol dehydrogenase family)
MLSQKTGGSVVSVGASIADHPIAMFTASVPMITKGGINAISRSLAMEYAKEGIRVNVVAPGIVDTPLLENWRTDNVRQHNERWRRTTAERPGYKSASSPNPARCLR